MEIMAINKEVKEINKFRSLFPNIISVKVEKSGGVFLANVKTFPGLLTQADSFSGLIEMVNDAVRTYFEIPDKYLPFMPDYKPPLSEAQRLGVFPLSNRKSTEIQLEKIQNAARTAR